MLRGPEILDVVLQVEMQPGQPPKWSAMTNRFHFPGWNGTPLGQGSSPLEALDQLDSVLAEIAAEAMGEPEPLETVELRRIEEDTNGT
jgi:hypothetical protein